MSFNPQLADSDGRKHYPSNWPNQYVSDHAGRFIARYRVAKAVEISFDSGISEQIGDAYSAFTKLFLAYSAFEIFSKAFGLSCQDLDSIDSQHGGSNVVAAIRRLHDQSPRFFPFIESQLNSGPAKKNINNFVSGNSVTALSLAKSFRHIFAHGMLTPSSEGSDSQITKRIGDFLYNHIMKIMDAEASSLAKQKIPS